MLLLPGCEEPPTAQWAEKTWRLDAGPNRTSYSRQMEALVRLCSEGDGLMSQLLREASVTRLADWAAREREGMSLPGMEAEAEVMQACSRGRMPVAWLGCLAQIPAMIFASAHKRSMGD